MSAGKTCADSGRRYVDVNIGSTGTSGSYTDICRNKITISPEPSVRSPSGLNGYKKYTHTFGSYYVGGINYNGTRQIGFPLSLSTYYNKNVIVYYLGYDEDNVLPLLVKLTKSNTTHEYYKKVDYFSTPSSWNKDSGIRNDSKLSTTLPGITKNLNTVIVLKIDQTSSGNYFANGESSPPPANLNTQITVAGSTYETVYNNYVHKLLGKRLRLLSTKNGGVNIPFEDSVYGTEYSEAHVYFWNGDNSHKNPLLLELKQTTSSSSYYTLADTDERTGKKWKPESGIETSTLKKKLDKENCKNGAHIIDISRNSGANKYPCLTEGCSVSITFVNYGTNDYSYYLHSIDGSIRRLEDKGVEQTGVEFLQSMTQANVYWYPKGPYRIPLLIYLTDSDKWYQRTSIDSSNWTDVRVGKPSGYNDNPKILELLRSKLPSVTINVGDTKVGEDEQSTTYDDTSGGITEKISLTRHDIKLDEGSTEYTSFVHSVQDKPFVARDVKHNNDTLQGIDLSFILNSVTAYYEEGNLNSMDGLLMIGLEKRNGPNKYSYYGRRDGGSGWVAISNQTEKLGSLLTTKLGQLKDELANSSQLGLARPPATGPGGNQGEAGSPGHDGATGVIDGSRVTDPGPQNFGDRISTFIRSHSAIIGGGVGGGLATAGLGGLAVWKWPVIMSRLITRL